ncbi:hypothetical protein SLH46_03805 [Draconibacterium sp. IB214405]|uniref:hypothetical protein n=1 Tax=Draconibacterium sp. IB214405 TaxID=3097352 RepID=UPI002A0D9A7E|nr:hypothetical protein [Draconibacterium sp. IB214405]MDX8338296.1 hypothetical protein [Draconibacterium sp. IB214405]
MKLLDAISCFLFFITFHVAVSAQESTKHALKIDVDEVALLSLQSENGDAVNFEAVQPRYAGQQIEIQQKEQSGIWINYSSIVKANQRRKVTASVVGDIPQGVVVKVMASENRGAGKGQLGEPVPWVTLKNGTVDVISNIGSCYTGRGIQNGHLISYKVELDDESDQYALLSENTTSLQIMYTLTDDN